MSALTKSRAKVSGKDERSHSLEDRIRAVGNGIAKARAEVARRSGLSVEPTHPVAERPLKGTTRPRKVLAATETEVSGTLAAHR